MKGSASRLGLPLYGKIVLGIITVSAATIGFTLGYLVGRDAPSSAAPSPARQSVNEAAAPSTVPSQAPDTKNEASSSAIPAGQVPSVENRTSDVAAAPPERVSSKQATKEEGKAALSGTRTNPVSDIKTASREKGQAGQTVASPPTRQYDDTSAQTSAAREGTEGASPGSLAPLQDKIVYTVQAGAFRGRKDAEALKHQLEAKGYKVSVRKEPGAKGVTYYKVITGEFEKKKEASVLALKLKKTDGLNAFATVKK